MLTNLNSSTNSCSILIVITKCNVFNTHCVQSAESLNQNNIHFLLKNKKDYFVLQIKLHSKRACAYPIKQKKKKKGKNNLFPSYLPSLNLGYLIYFNSLHMGVHCPVQRTGQKFSNFFHKI